MTGWYAVDSVNYLNGLLAAIELRFEQRCEGAQQALRGKIRWSSADLTAPPGPVNPPPPTLWQAPAGATPALGNYVYLQSTSGDYIGQGGTYLHTLANSLMTFTPAGSYLKVGVNGTKMWTGDFQAMVGLTQLQPGYYGSLQRYPFHNPVVGGLSWSGNGRGCNTLTGWFVVDSINYTAGTLSAVGLRFEQHCEGAAPALRGKIRWASGDSTAPVGPVNPPPANLWLAPPGATPDRLPATSCICKAMRATTSVPGRRSCTRRPTRR